MNSPFVPSIPIGGWKFQREATYRRRVHGNRWLLSDTKTLWRVMRQALSAHPVSAGDLYATVLAEMGAIGRRRMERMLARLVKLGTVVRVDGGYRRGSG